MTEALESIPKIEQILILKQIGKDCILMTPSQSVNPCRLAKHRFGHVTKRPHYFVLTAFYEAQIDISNAQIFFIGL